VAHTIDRGIDAHGAGTHLLEQDPQLVLIHST
jgi:hypothetical protein